VSTSSGIVFCFDLDILLLLCIHCNFLESFILLTKKKLIILILSLFHLIANFHTTFLISFSVNQLSCNLTCNWHTMWNKKFTILKTWQKRPETCHVL
jgi:hypothetical protein